MRLSLFSRLVIGYLAVFTLVGAVAVYAIVQLHRLSDISSSLLETDNRILDYEKKLTDTLLSQIRYERKFVIAQDETLYQQFMIFKRDFERGFEELRSLVGSEATARLAGVREPYERYQRLFNEEAAYLRTGQSYSQDRYKTEKEAAAERIIAELEALGVESQRRVYGKIAALTEAGDNARRVALLMAAVSLIVAVTVSLFITRSITQPISALEGKTREIAVGNFGGPLDLSSPPEIAELAKAFNLMSRRLNEVEQMKSDFFSSMSHELRTPLASIKEGSGLLLEGVAGPITEKQQRLLAIIEEESHRLIALVNSLLDLSKMEAGMMTYSFERSSLAPMIDGAMRGIEPLAKSRKIDVQADIGRGLPDVRIDGERILQVLRNLIGNAVKFTPQGGEVKVSARAVDRGVEVSVADTGPGIPKESLTAVFNKFEQVGSAGGSHANGTGLGLAIAKHVITAHGGTIWVESEPGRGSRFVFFLPA